MGICIAILWHLWMPWVMLSFDAAFTFKLKHYFLSETSGEELEAESCEVFIACRAGTAGSVEDWTLSFYQCNPPLTVLDIKYVSS